MAILGLTSQFSEVHDNSVALVEDSKLIYATAEERFSRIKHDRSFPVQALEKGFQFTGLNLKNIDTVAIGSSNYPIYTLITNDKTRILKTLLRLSLNFPLTTLIQVPAILSELFLPKILRRVKPSLAINCPIIHVEHHLAHAASVYYLQPHDEALVLAFDGYGPNAQGTWLSGAVFQGVNSKLTPVIKVPVQASLGLLYQNVTVALGFAPNDGEGKTMGLAAYGKPSHAYNELLSLAPHWDGTNWTKMKQWPEMMLAGRTFSRSLFLATNTGQFMVDLIQRFGPENLAWAGQKILADEMVAFVSSLLVKPTHLTLSGGIFLNVKMNQKLREIPLVKSVSVHPNAGDGGTAAGAALAVNAQFNAARDKTFRLGKHSELRSANLGVSFTEAEIKNTILDSREQITYKKAANLPQYVAQKIAKGVVIGWFQGRAEWGPRALGYRSVLADPRKIEVKDRINNLLKQREWFMPFAPSILEEEASTWFKGCTRSPFMTMLYDVYPNKAKLIPAALHIDNTARPNTVHKADNPLYYQVIKEFQKLTGIPVILNTSFNKHGLPIVNSPRDAIEHLLMDCVDELAIGPYIVKRKT